MTAKLTPWFPGTVKPVRPGVYQRQFSWGNLYSEWTGRRWMEGESSVRLAKDHLGNESIWQETPLWRGLAKKPRK